MASHLPNVAVAVPQNLVNASATSSSHPERSYSMPHARLNTDRDNAWGTDIWRNLRAQTTNKRKHPSVYWCTSKEYVKKRAVAIAPRLPYFDASSWCVVPEADPSAMQWGKCHLLSLPKELRLEIWRHVLTDPSVPDVAVEITRAPRGPGKTSLRFPDPCIQATIRPPRNAPISIDILATNESIYKEALPVLYHSVRFAPLDLESIFPLFLGTLSSFAQSHIRHIKLRIPPVIYDTDPFGNPSTPLVNWAITCAQVAKIADLRDVQIEGYSSQFSSERIKHGILNPLCRVKAKKTFTNDINNEAQQALKEADKELQAQVKVRRQRGLSEATERADRDTSTMHEPLQRTYSLPVRPFTLPSTIEGDTSHLPGVREFEQELQEHEMSNSVFEDVPKEEVDLGIGDWEMVALKSGESTPKAMERDVVEEGDEDNEEETDDDVWTDAGSTLVETRSGESDDGLEKCFAS
ncbi:hypothetical protein K458DRAFT_412865 [Lentithecium fluviatile CBS 122367]|uniref:DUF7730 domain-containing protein n=1 Tax=Lentithecium fluviatile CBS 122367 TaxID=1168545 RepID=A0A6G1JHJ8_9PLEO|nr:hypothetical protein K458DRAFT_412865 [Lentithecium fluviatile CBS 122367]